MASYSGINSPSIFIPSCGSEDDQDVTVNGNKLYYLPTESSGESNLDGVTSSQESQAGGISSSGQLFNCQIPVEHNEIENRQPEDDSMGSACGDLHSCETTDDEENLPLQSKRRKKRKRPESPVLKHFKEDCIDEPCANSQSSSSSSSQLNSPCVSSDETSSDSK